MMMNKEAIEIFRNLGKISSYELPYEVYEAACKAILALEKQEGKRPEETGLMGVHIPVCANCKNPLMFITGSARSDFCPKCGKKILWE